MPPQEQRLDFFELLVVEKEKAHRKTMGFVLVGTTGFELHPQFDLNTLFLIYLTNFNQFGELLVPQQILKTNLVI